MCLPMIPEVSLYNHTANKWPIMAILLSDDHQTWDISYLSVVNFCIRIIIKPKLETSSVFEEVKE